MAQNSKKDIKKLSLMERMILPGILPKETNYADLVIKADILEKIKITQDEILQFHIKGNEDGSVSCNKEGAAAEFEYQFSKLELDAVGKAIRKMEQEQKLTLELRGIYEKFGK